MVHIRQAEEKDIEGILAIYNDVIINTTAVYDYYPHTYEQRKQWFDQKKESGYPVVVAEENGTILGFSSLGPFRSWDAYRYTVENAVYVSSHARGKGIGKLLLQEVIDLAVKMDMHTILAGIDATNEASINLHKKFGFTQVAIMKEVGFKFNKWLDLVFLQLLLPTPARPVSPEVSNNK